MNIYCSVADSNGNIIKPAYLASTRNFDSDGHVISDSIFSESHKLIRADHYTYDAYGRYIMHSIYEESNGTDTFRMKYVISGNETIGWVYLDATLFSKSVTTWNNSRETRTEQSWIASDTSGKSFSKSVYDADDRIVERVYSNGAKEEFFYDSAGNFARKKRIDGFETDILNIDNHYENGMLTRWSTDSATVHLGYDKRGMIIYQLWDSNYDDESDVCEIVYTYWN